MAIRIIQRRFGGPETLEVVEVESPTASDLGPDEVLVAAAAAGVNPIDVMTRTGGGMAATGAITLPFTPGWDVAGTVRAVGAGATGLAPGQRVRSSPRKWCSDPSMRGQAVSAGRASVFTSFTGLVVRVRRQRARTSRPR